MNIDLWSIGEKGSKGYANVYTICPRQANKNAIQLMKKCEKDGPFSMLMSKKIH